MSTAAQKALWWTADYLWAGLAWKATIAAPSSAQYYAEGPQSDVVVLPGVFESWRFIRPLISALHAAGHPVHVVPGLGHNLCGLDSGAALLLDELRRRELTDVVLVAHSKGGLIGKLALTRDTDQRIRRLIAICTPFNGSSHARLFPVPPISALDPSDPLIDSLGNQTMVNARITAISSRFDEQVPDGTTLVGARNIVAPVHGHFRPLGHPATLRMIVSEVESA